MPKRYSHSLLGTFRECRQKYRFQYVERVRTERRQSAPMMMGGIIHRVLKNLYQVASFDKLVSLEEALIEYDKGWENIADLPITVPNENLAVDDYMASGRKMLAQFYNSNQPFNQGTLLAAESKINYDLPGTMYQIQIIVDRLWKRPDGVIEIIDYKTGRYLPRGGRDKRFLDQMGLYYLGIKTTWPQYETIELVQPFLALDETIRYRPEEEELDELAERVRGTILDIKQAERLEDFPTTEGGHCRFCDYQTLCPAKRHERMLAAEEEAGGDSVATAQAAGKTAGEFIRLDGQLKELKANQDALKKDLKRLAAELNLSKFTCPEGEVSVKLGTKEKFITKTNDATAFADLSKLARDLDLEYCFTLDGNALMRDIYSKGRLDPKQLEQLEPFVKTVDASYIRAKAARITREDDD